MRLGREKILICGDPKVGKTRSALTFARGLPQSKFIILEPDDGSVKILNELKLQYDEITPSRLSLGERQVQLFRPMPKGWNGYYSCLERISKWVDEHRIGSEDWVITEGLDIVVENMRHEFSDRTAQAAIAKAEIKGVQPSSWEAYIAKRQQGKPIIDRGDWDAIYSEFSSALNFFALQMPCNWIGTSGTTEIERDDKQTKDSQQEQQFYASMGMPVKVAGYRQVPRKVDTILLLGKSLATGYSFQVYGDRGSELRGQNSNSRTVPQMQANKDLFQDYLVKMVGWTIPASNGIAPPPPPLMVS